VLILKGVKVICFDTLLQVLILKAVSTGVRGTLRRANPRTKDNAEAQRALRGRREEGCGF
jgi:hypothetical protein